MFVVEGVKPVQELLASGLHIETIYSTETDDHTAPNVDVVSISRKELERISALKTPNKTLATVRIPTEKSIDWQRPLLLMLDGISDPGNLGTIIRTAKWFGVSQVICSQDCVDVYDHKVVQSTMGALFHVDIIYTSLESALEAGANQGFHSVGAAMNGNSLYAIEKTNKTILVIGSESHGISAEILARCNEHCTIPNREKEQRVESLNAGIATAIILAELTRNG